MPLPHSLLRLFWLVLSLALAPGVSLAAARHAVPADPPSAKAHAFTVAVLGDGFAEALAEGLTLNVADEPDVAVLQRTHSPTGLADRETYDWAIAAANLLAGPERIDAAVIMLGANDTRPLQDGSESVDPQSPRWRALYGARVAAVAAVFRDRGVPLTWVGLPVVQDDRLSQGFVTLNEIIRENARAAGADYVDSWEAFVDEGGQYSGIGPDLNGRTATLRTRDGIDFTRAGARKLASFVEPDLRRARDRPPPLAPVAIALPALPGFDAALAIDVGAQIRREAGLPALSPAEANVPGRPTAGPIIVITAPAASPDGRLADARLDPAGAREGDPLVRRALVDGLPIPPKPGRLDDFAWPRP